MSVVDFDQRPIVDLSILCIPIPMLPEQLCFTLPGGVELCINRRLNIGLVEYASMALGLANTAVAPLKPLFMVVDVALSIFEVLKIIPEVITDPTKASKLNSLIEKLTRKMIALAKLVPPFSIIVLALNLLDTVILILQGFQAEINSLVRFSVRIEAAQFNVSQAPGLDAIISCSESSLAIQMENMQSLFASLNGVLTILNFVGVTAQLKGFPIVIDSGDSTTLTKIADVTHPARVARDFLSVQADVLTQTLGILNAARNAIPNIVSR